MRSTASRLFALLAAALMPIVVHAHDEDAKGETLPPSSDYVITSVNHAYRLHIDNDPESPHYYPVLKGLVDSTALDRPGSFSVGNPQGYHHGYSLLGFAASYFGGGERNVYYWDCSDGEEFDCNNGFATTSSIHMPVTLYGAASHSCTRMVLGHELFHKVQSAYTAAGAPSFGTWAKEGQARAMQDKIYTDLDTDPAASCVAEYNDQVDSYLGNPDVTIWSASYSAALFWTYLMEQFGSNDEEPTLGADFLAGWWFASILDDAPTGSVALTDEVIAVFDPEEDLLSAFRSFAIANLVKDFDLSSASDAFRARYTYRDEDPIGPLAQDFYAAVKVSTPVALTDLDNEATRQLAVNDHGAEYHRFDVSQCSAGRTLKLSFETEPTWQGYPLNTLGAWGAEFTRGSPPRIAYHYRVVENDWSVSVLQTNPPIETVYSIASGVGDAVFGNVRMQCLDTVYQPRFPVNDTFAPLLPGPTGSQFNGGVRVAVADIGGDNLDPRQLSFRVGTQAAPVVAAVRDGADHLMRLRLPDVPADGTYTLAASLGTATASAPVRYGTPTGTVVFIVDGSAPMAQPAGGSRLAATRDALAYLIDSLGDDVRVGLVTHAADSIEPNNDAVVRVAPAPLTASHRVVLDNALAAMATDPNRPLAAYGDAAVAAAALPPPTGGAPHALHWVFVAAGEPGIGEPAPASVVATARSVGARVHTVSLGPTTQQAMLANLAARTGGAYHGVPIASVTDVGLYQLAAFEIANAIEDRQIVFETEIPLGAAQDRSIEVPSAALGLLLPGVRKLAIAATWSNAASADGLDIAFVPVAGGSGQVVREGSTHALAREETPLAEPLPRTIRILETRARAPDVLKLQVAARTLGGARLLTGVSPAAGGPNDEIQFVFHPIRFAAAAYDGEGVLDVDRLRFYLTAPDGRSFALRARPGFAPSADDATSDDQAGWNWVASLLRPTTAVAGSIHDGRYMLTTIAHVTRGDYSGRLISRRAFHVAVPPAGSPDGDGDGLPDAVESAHACLDPAVPEPTSSDDDGDGALTFTEFQRGTDPCDPDTDEGGEQDGSEILANADPLDADDDTIERVAFAIVDTSPHDHDGEDGHAARSHAIVASLDQTHAVVELVGGPSGEPEKSIATRTVQAGDGDMRFVHADLEAGREYCYRAIARTTSGRRAAPSPFACAVARNDATVPWGSIVLHRGSPRTDDGQVRAYLGLYNEDPATTQMQLEIDGVAGRAFQPYVSPVPIPYPTVGVPRRFPVAVRFRDADGNVSPWYRDGLVVHPPGTLGEIRGRVFAPRAKHAAGKGVQPLAGVWIELLGHPTERGAVTAADGSFVLTDLVPRDYVLRVAHPGVITLDTNIIALGAGDVMQLGDIGLASDDPLFGDGFE